MVKKNLSIILVILFAILLIATVIWVFDKRIESIEKGKASQTVINSSMASSNLNSKPNENTFKLNL